MEYKPEIINITDYVTRVHSKLVDLIENQLNQDFPNLTIVNTVNKCDDILVKELQVMYEEAKTKILSNRR